MSETIRDVCTAALRKARQVRVGGTPAAEELEATRQTLQSIYLEFVQRGTFGRIEDVSVSASGPYEAGENQRIYNHTPSDVTFEVILPETIADPEGERPPRDGAVVLVAGDPLQAFIYSGSLGAWLDLADANPSAPAPLADLSFDGLASLLALRIAGDYGADVAAAVGLSAASFLSLLTHRSARPSSPPAYF